MKKSQRHSRYKVHRSRSRSTTSPKRKRSKASRKSSPKRKRSTASYKKKQSEFLFNPNNPHKSFDVYIDKNPKDTISIKYTTYQDVVKTIEKLEKLYKSKKYDHKRISQVAMILRVRLRVLKRIKNKHYNLAKRYVKFLKHRTKLKTFNERQKFKFDF